MPNLISATRLRQTLVTAATVGAAFALATQPAFAAPLGQDAISVDEVWPVLLPLMASAIAVERGIEVVWNYADWVLLNVRGWSATDLKAPAYLQFKSGTSMVFGIVLGILISNYTGMRLFDYLRPLAPRLLESVPAAWDVLITGFIIGAGSKPTHDLLGIITQTKNLLAYGAVRQREAAGAAMAEGVLKLAQSDAQALIDVPGVGPSRLAAPGQGLRGDEDGLPIAPTSTEQYIRILHDKTVG